MMAELKTMGQPFVRSLSYRKVGEATKVCVDEPEFARVEDLIGGIDAAEIECLTLYGPEDEKLFVIGKPGFYHLTLFVDETDGYAFDEGSGDQSKIAIAGDFWPSFRVCKDRRVLTEVAHQFYLQGQPATSSKWLAFSED